MYITVYGCTRSGRIFYGVLPGLYRASRQLPKSRSSVTPSTDFETMASHDAGVVYFTEYLSVLFQLTSLDELYRECSGTAHACVNCGYQALSPITERLGTRLEMKGVSEAAVTVDCYTTSFLCLLCRLAVAQLKITCKRPQLSGQYLV